MIDNKTFLAIIPARKNSKRIILKNTKILAGKPLLLWTIESAKNSKYIDKIIISSDDEKIEEIAKKEKVYFSKRPSELATDEAKTVDVVVNLLLKEENLTDYIILLQPTSPLRNHKHIDEAIEFLLMKDADAVISICETDHNPLWCGIIKENLSLKGFINNDLFLKRSQELPKYYRLNGAIYICKTNLFLKEKTFFLPDKIYGFIMDKKSSIDIDDEFDFQLAEYFILKNKNE